LFDCLITEFLVEDSPSSETGFLLFVHGSAEFTLAELIEERDTAWSLAQLAKLLGCSRGKLYSLVESNRIPHIRLGGLIRFDPKSTAKWLRSQSIQL